MKYLKNFFKHLHTVNKHRLLVFKLCIKAGIPWRGFVHDLSKYSPTEFFESVKYYVGDKSPIMLAKLDIGYSKAWLHHKGRNKHHYEYWYDYSLSKPEVVMPLKYFKEMICDNLAAGLTYQGKNWTKEYQLSYWNKVKDNAKMDERLKKLLTKIYTDISIYGINKVLNKNNLDTLYKEAIKGE